MFLFYCSSSFYHCNYLSNRRITMFGPTNNAACTPQSTSGTSACNLTAVSQFTLWVNVPSGEVVSPSRWRLSPPPRVQCHSPDLQTLPLREIWQRGYRRGLNGSDRWRMHYEARRCPPAPPAPPDTMRSRGRVRGATRDPSFPQRRRCPWSARRKPLLEKSQSLHPLLHCECLCTVG